MAEESIGTATAKRKSKRRKPTRQPDAESIIGESERDYIIESDGESGTESDGESGTEPGSNGSPKWWSFGNSGESRDTRTGRESTGESAKERNRDDEETPFTVGQSEAVVSPTKIQPKRTYAKKAKGSIQGEDVERLLVQSFSWVALLKQASYWNIDDPEHEIRPWSPQAAELLNRLLADRAQQFKDSSDIMSVGIGMFMLVNMRVQKDIAVRKQRIALAREQIVEEEHYTENGFDNTFGQNTGVTKPTIFGNGIGIS